jgi:creatinine amidohydrolase
MMSGLPIRLADLTTESLRTLFGQRARVAALVPVGSVEPHGPHLPLGTDTMISEAAAAQAALKLAEQGIYAFVAPTIPYGVTCFAESFAGAVSVSAAALTAFLRAVLDAYLEAGFSHVCLVNNHLEPAQDAAVRAAIAPLAPSQASVACPLARRWGSTLSPEFKSGACHAGRYETSLVLAVAPQTVDVATAYTLPSLGISLAEGIKAGHTSFRSMGLDRAYTGAPAEASVAEGQELLEKLAIMVATEVSEALGLGQLKRRAK